MVARLLAVTILALGLSACSDDTKPITIPDRSIIEAGVEKEFTIRVERSTREAGPPPPISCVGEPDGKDCSPTGEPALLAGSMICRTGKCVVSSCGDKYVHAAAGEDCDDGNAVADDGCNNCKFTCKENPDCDDLQPCNGAETCDTTTHKCVPGTPAADATPCNLPGGVAGGLCHGGVCALATCGNKTVEAGEDCDDGNTVGADGCENNCKFTCAKNDDCSDGNACNGAETCDLATHICKAAASAGPPCNDNKDCTNDSCNPATGQCVYTPRDLDKDGKSCEADCNDNDPTVYVNAQECADGKDNDCDGDIDEIPLATGRCWLDKDGDTFAVAGAAFLSQCGCPVGYTNRDPAGAPANQDCNDTVASVFPGQTAYFTTPFCTAFQPGVSPPACTGTVGFDFNCSKVEEKQWTAISTGCRLVTIPGTPAPKLTCLGDGWTAGPAPDCGKDATFRSCVVSGKGCMSLEATRRQACR